MERRGLEGKEGEMAPPGGGSVAILKGPLAQLPFQNFIATSLAFCICPGTGSSLLLQRPDPSADKPACWEGLPCTSSFHAQTTASQARGMGVWGVGVRQHPEHNRCRQTPWLPVLLANGLAKYLYFPEPQFCHLCRGGENLMTSSWG